MDYTARIPADWKPVMTKGDQQWIGKTVFEARNKISDTAAVTLWWYPPTAEASARPNPEQYVLRRLCLWMPRKAWGIDVKCPNCPSRSLQ